VGELASGLAHELGTPLNVIGGRARLIEEADGASDEVRADATVVREEAAKMTALVRQLLGFARRTAPEKQEADVAGAAARVAQLLAPLAAGAGVVIELAAPGGPCVVRGDPLLIEQAITNLAVNGIQAMRSGGRLSLTVLERLVAQPGTAARTPSAVVAVTDDGPGIRPEDQRRIFDPFFTTKDVGEGTGLGLSVVYGIALDHGGFVHVKNEPGRGARFELVFPAEGKQASIVPPPMEEEPS
jgi:signal transduction histidine kinase